MCWRLNSCLNESICFLVKRGQAEFSRHGSRPEERRCSRYIVPGSHLAQRDACGRREGAEGQMHWGPVTCRGPGPVKSWKRLTSTTGHRQFFTLIRDQWHPFLLRGPQFLTADLLGKYDFVRRVDFIQHNNFLSCKIGFTGFLAYQIQCRYPPPAVGLLKSNVLTPYSWP